MKVVIILLPECLTYTLTVLLYSDKEKTFTEQLYSINKNSSV
jgi:hypothetical protein